MRTAVTGLIDKLRLESGKRGRTITCRRQSRSRVAGNKREKRKKRKSGKKGRRTRTNGSVGTGTGTHEALTSAMSN